MSFHKKFPILILSILCICFLAFFYGELLLSPNQYLFSGKGDGIKNYFTYAHHIKNNSSTTNFEGFNYPYGEHFLYTDGQPLFAVLQQELSKSFPSIEHYSIGAINFLMLLSFYLGALFLYLLLKQLRVSTTLSIIGAFSIMVLSPQIFRMNGHLALSYSCFIPITIYLLYQYLNSNRPSLWIFLILFNNLFWLFIHAYLGIIAISTLLAFELVQLIISLLNKRNYSIKKGLTLLITAAAPILIFRSLVAATDTHLYRDNNPYGFFEYYADFDTIFLPNHGWLKDFIFNLLPSFTQTWEGWAYIGLSSIIMLSLFAFLHLRRLIQPASSKALSLDLPFLQYFFGGSILLLVFSFGIPFRWGLEGWLDHLPVLKQFRSIGRFAWVFYFASTISAVYLTQQFANQLKQKSIAKIIVLGVPLLMVLEGVPHHLEVGSKSVKSTNYFNEKYLPREIKEGLQTVNAKNYQAIIPLPYYNIGTENYEREGGNQIYKLSMSAAYHLNVPIVGSYLTRTSLLEGRNSLQILSPDFYSKKIKKDITSKKPFLIVKSMMEPLEKDESSLLSKSKVLYESEQFGLYELQFDSLFNETKEQEINAFRIKKSELLQKGTYWTNENDSFFHLGSKQTFNKNDHNLIFKLKSNQLSIQNEYHASVWFNGDGNNIGQDQLNFLKFKAVETLNDSILQEKNVEVMSSSIIHDHWTRAEINFTPKSAESEIAFISVGNDPINKNLEIEDFFLSKSAQETYWFNNDSSILYKNNHRLKY